MWGIMIPIVAIAGSFAIPIVAIIMDYRRRKLQYEERRAMIERGMQPPPLDDKPFDVRGADRREHRLERALPAGITLLSLGVGLGLGAYLLASVVTQSFIPRAVVGPLAVGACVVGFIGIGNLIYYAVARKRSADADAAR